ncbi:hypothetical protein JKP88DRAFT_216464 [Tribonema minus]|uniref:Uncharacterized protein n=1 Tax=Tribonema minus TaxID=303371 RepID=A0A836C759_9STRA|nr:hypothetical protein JKP88DRAFT_216464 [Tribonema minus]
MSTWGTILLVPMHVPTRGRHLLRHAHASTTSSRRYYRRLQHAHSGHRSGNPPSAGGDARSAHSGWPRFVARMRAANRFEVGSGMCVWLSRARVRAEPDTSGHLSSARLTPAHVAVQNLKLLTICAPSGARDVDSPVHIGTQFGWEAQGALTDS